jgi:putative nucleotidyltransferase with HDIG domain
VRIAATLEVDVKLWQTLPDAGSRYSVLPLDPGGRMPASPARIDSICQAFADIVDAKSPFTFQHSVGVAHNAVLIAEELGLGAPKITTIRRAALLHDIGKLGVSNAILDKPDKLTDEEWQAMKMHPLYTRQILEVITGFEEIAEVAGAHHEKLDGSGYPNRMTGTHISLLQRLVVVADVFQALSERRPYRDAIPPETVLTMMAADVPHKLDAECFQALRRRTQSFNGIQTKTFTQAAGR